MRIIAPNRNDPIILDNRTTLRFADVMESLVDEVNNLMFKPITTITDDYTLIETDANTVIRYTGNSNITITIPDNVFEEGTEIEIQNESSTVITVGITTDTLTSSAGLGIGSREIAADGDARLFSTTTTTWKISGNQIS